jgi:hypothetical protein
MIRTGHPTIGESRLRGNGRGKHTSSCSRQRTGRPSNRGTRRNERRDESHACTGPNWTILAAVQPDEDPPTPSVNAMSAGQTRPRGTAANSTPITSFFGVQQGNEVQPKITIAAMEFDKGAGKLGPVPNWFDRLVCRFSAHDWWALAYPPARRWECHRCGVIVEDAPTSTPDRRRVPRDRANKAGGQTRT